MLSALLLVALSGASQIKDLDKILASDWCAVAPDAAKVSDRLASVLRFYPNPATANGEKGIFAWLLYGKLDKRFDGNQYVQLSFTGNYGFEVIKEGILLKMDVRGCVMRMPTDLTEKEWKWQSFPLFRPYGITYWFPELKYAKLPHRENRYGPYAGSVVDVRLSDPDGKKWFIPKEDADFIFFGGFPTKETFDFPIQYFVDKP